MSLTTSSKKMPENPLASLDNAASGEFRGSIRRSFILWITILALIPVILVVSTNYFYNRSAALQQAFSQLETTAGNSNEQLSQIHPFSQDYLKNLLSSEWVSTSLKQLFSATAEELVSAQFDTYFALTAYIQSNREFHGMRIDHVIIIDTNGIVVASSNNDWRDDDFGDSKAIMHLSGTEETIFTFNTPPLYIGQLTILSSNPILDENGNLIATAISTATSSTPILAISAANSAYASSRAYFYTWENSIIQSNDAGEFKLVPSNRNFETQIKSLAIDKGRSRSYLSYDDISVAGYGIWMPDISLGLVIEAPEKTIFEAINSLLPFNILLVVVAMIATLGIVFIGSNRLIRPLVSLSNIGKAILSSENRTIEKPKNILGLQRKDEIGVISNAFNKMGEQIIELEETLQTQVEQRTQAMRTASEVVRRATSTTQRQELVDRACQLLVEKFGFSFASIFILDESRNYAILQGVSRVDPQPKIPENHRVNVAADTLVGWVAMNNQTRSVQNFELEPAFRSLLTTSRTRSEIALPIHSASASEDVVGVMSIQSPEINSFTPDTAGVLENLVAQIAAGLQNIQVFEATEMKLKELNLLYTTSRQIAQSNSEKEMMQILSSALAQTNYVSGIFSVEAFYLSVLGIIDPRSPNVTSAQGITLPLQKIGQKVERNSMVLVEYLTQPTEFDNLLSFFSRRGCRSAALFFVYNQASLSKIFVIGSRDLNPLQAEKLTPFNNLVEVMSTALEHFQVLGSLELRLGELQTLARISKAISAETNLDQLYRLLHAEIEKTFGNDVHFLVATYDEKSSMIHIPYMIDEGNLVPVEPFPLGQGMTSILIRNREPLMLVKDTERKAAELGAKIIGKTAKSWLGVPLIVGGRVLGAMVLQDTDREERFDDNDLRLMVTLSSPVANAIRNAQLLGEMQEALQAYDQERFLLNVLLENIPDMIYFKDLDGKFIRASYSTIANFGLNSPEEIQGKTINELEPKEEEASRITQSEQEVISSKQSHLNTLVQYHPNEENETWALVSKIPLLNKEDKIVGLLGIESDITSLKNTEQIAQRRAQQILTAAEIARDTTSELDVTEILSKSINLIRERFGFYHASVFLLDPLKEYAILRESTGEVGRAMKERQHRLAVGSQSIVGRATATRKPLIINDVTKDPNYFANPLLPDTRSELAIPLMAGNELLGAIDVQSNRLNAFSDEDMGILQILADQLAVAILNADLFTEARETLRQHQSLHGITNEASTADSMEKAVEIITQSLHQLRQNERVVVFLLNSNNQLQVQASSGYEHIDLSNLRISIGEGIVGKAAATKKPYRVDDITADSSYLEIDRETRSELAVPILYGEQLMGVINIESPEPVAYDENDQEILATLGTNLGTILANTRLVSEVRQQVDRQRQLYDITSKIRRSVDIQTILQTFTTEVCNALQARSAKVSIMTSADEDSPHNGNGHTPEPGQPQGKEEIVA